MKDFKEFLIEELSKDDKTLAKQNSYGKNLAEAFRHMNNNVKMYCENHDINYDNSRFELELKIITEKSAEKAEEEKAEKVEEPTETKEKSEEKPTKKEE